MNRNGQKTWDSCKYLSIVWVTVANLPSYPYSKLLLLLAYREFTTKIVPEGSDVAVNLLNPGLCTTTLAKDAPFFIRSMIGLHKLIMGRTPEMGSRTLIHGLTGEGHGKYLSACEIHE